MGVNRTSCRARRRGSIEPGVGCVGGAASGGPSPVPPGHRRATRRATRNGVPDAASLFLAHRTGASDSPEHDERETSLAGATPRQEEKEGNNAPHPPGRRATEAAPVFSQPPVASASHRVRGPAGGPAVAHCPVPAGPGGWQEAPAARLPGAPRPKSTLRLLRRYCSVAPPVAGAGPVSEPGVGRKTVTHRAQHPFAPKLDPASAQVIRERYQAGESPSHLAADFGVAVSTLYDVIRGRSYRTPMVLPLGVVELRQLEAIAQRFGLTRQQAAVEIMRRGIAASL